MVEWSITVVLKTTVLRGTGGSNPKLKPADFQRVSCFSPLEVPFEVPFYFYESLTWNLGESKIFDRKSTQNITIEALYFCFSLAV